MIDSPIDRLSVLVGLKNLVNVSASFFDDPISVFHIGCADGFDTEAYKAVWPDTVEWAITRPHIPFTYQLDNLLKAIGVDKDFWDVDQVPCAECGPVEYSPSLKHLYFKRDRHLIDAGPANLLIYYYNGQPGGTQYTIEYAEKKGVPTIDVRDITVAYLSERFEEVRGRGSVL